MDRLLTPGDYRHIQFVTDAQYRLHLIDSFRQGH
jgi:hypothetical protein